MDKLSLYMIYLWTVVAVGRPQDIFPVLKVIRPGDWAAGLSLGFYILFADKRRPVFSSPEFKLFFAFVAIAILCTPFGFFPRASVYFLRDFFLKFGLYLFLVAKLITTEEHVEGMVKTFLLSGFMMTFAAVTQIKAGVRVAVGTTYDPNDLAALIVATLPIAVIQIQTTESRLWKLFCFGGAIAGLIGLIATQSRGGFIGLIIVVIFAFFTKVQGFSKKRLTVLAVIMGIIFVMQAGTDYKERISTIFEDVSSLQAGSGRMMIWKRALVIASDHPILGVGPNCFSSAYGYYLEHGKFKGDIWRGATGGSWSVTHNSLLQILVEMGIPGFLIFMGIIIYTFKNFRKLKIFYSEGKISKKLESQVIALEMVLVGYLACAFFLTHAYSITLYLICILSGAMIWIVSDEFQLK
jgi:O-antigen ligase